MPTTIPALVMGSDSKVYLSVQDSTNQNPTTDASNTYWREFGAAMAGATSFAGLTGVAALNQLPTIPASKTSGIFNANQIPTLATSAIMGLAAALAALQARTEVEPHTSQANYDNASDSDGVLHVLAV